jgi:hypothetical protein
MRHHPNTNKSRSSCLLERAGNGLGRSDGAQRPGVNPAFENRFQYQGENKMKKHLTKKRVVFAALVIVALGLAGGVAFAYWTGGGSGSGSATAAAGPAGLTVNQTSASSGLYPGGSVALSGDFDNSNAYPVYVHSVTASVSGTSDVNCLASWFYITGSATVDAQVPTGSAQGAWSGLSLNMTNAAVNQDDCKSATIDIDYTANAS